MVRMAINTAYCTRSLAFAEGKLYAEGEYRFDISRNGLFGGAGFLNFQSGKQENSVGNVAFRKLV